MQSFFCNKRYDISFSDFTKLVKLIIPTNYELLETRGIYKKDYCPCNIIILTNNDTNEQNLIYCWLGQKGLTVLANNEFTTSICIEILKNVKQNPEDYKMMSFQCVDEQLLINELKQAYLIYHQINSSNDTSKYIIKEYNNDECSIEFYKNPDELRIYGAQSSLLIFIQLSIEKILNSMNK